MQSGRQYTVHLNNNQGLLEIRESLVLETVTAVLRSEQIAAAEIVVALVDDCIIHAVNREHLAHDYATDVISFLYESDRAPNTAKETGRSCGAQLDGELVLSVETALRSATEFGWDAEAEIRLYLVHGLLHLCGYDDLSDSEQAIMRNREREILKIWNLTPHYK